MKKVYFISAIVALSVLASTAPASALNFGIDAESKTNIEMNTKSDNRKDDDDNRKWNNDDKRDHDSRWKSWMFNSGISGTVTAVSGDSITVKASNNTSYTVDIDDAKIRYVMSGDTSITIGDRVFVQGVINGTNVVATMVIDADAKTDPKPADDEKREGIAGTVTAKSGTTLTVLGKNGTSYTVAAADAKIWKNKAESTTLSSIAVGDSVVVQGDVSGSSVTAARIYAVRLPTANADGDIRGTVTAVSGNTITILASGGATYTIDTDGAEFKSHKNKDADINDIKVGTMITVDGDVNGSTIDAEMITETNVKVGWFQRFGNFWKNLFGKK